MGMLDICSYNSYGRGLDYYESKRVKILRRLNEFVYDAQVEGSEVYDVHLDVNHPRKSTCTCPHAAGKQVICKHKVAVYFSIFPEEAQKAINERNEYRRELEEREKEYDRKVKEERKRITEYVKSLSNKEVRERLINYMVHDAMEYIQDPYDEDDDEWY